MTILGGAGTLYGPIIGSIVYTGMKDVVSKMIGNWELIVGFTLVFIMLAGEKGIWGTLEPRLKTADFARHRPAQRRGGSDDRHPAPDLRLHLRPEHGQHLLS